MVDGSHPLGLGVFVSGRGTNLLAILEAIQKGRLPARVQVVVSDRADAPALEYARKRDIPIRLVSMGKADRAREGEALPPILQGLGVELVVLAGFMRILPAIFLQQFAGRVINLHPSLLPAFPGLHAHRQALAYGAKVTGCTVHFVDEGVDTGPIILQEAISIQEGESEEQLTARIRVLEHRLLQEAIRLFAQGRLGIRGRIVHIAPPGGKSEVL